jgi:hypothetical protein
VRPVALEAVIAKAMRKPPDARFQSAAELALALNALMSNGQRHAETTRVRRGRWWSFGTTDVGRYQSTKPEVTYETGNASGL